MGRLLAALWLAAVAACPGAGTTYKEPATFLNETFRGNTPPSGTLTIQGDTAQAVQTILGHSYRTARVRFWRSGDRTAWILEEIGKVKPITTGIVVENGEIVSVDVLIYRESHGWEVHRGIFTRQFRGATLEGGRRLLLSRRINGISGATLSVNALTKLVRLALLFHHEVIGP